MGGGRLDDASCTRAERWASLAAAAVVGFAGCLFIYTGLETFGCVDGGWGNVKVVVVMVVVG
jgi:hypothetical protein